MFNAIMNERQTTCMDFEEEISQNCEHCHKTFVVKYWDPELDWYIDINNTNLCRDCAAQPDEN